MPVISILLVIALIGCAVWVLTTLVPMPEPYKKVIYAVAGILTALWLLQALGLGSLETVRIR